METLECTQALTDDCFVRFRKPEPLFKKPPAQVALLVLSSDKEPKSFPLYEGENLVGRSLSCNVRIDDKVLSKRHSMIDIEDGHYLIQDLNSLNGTFKGKLRLKPSVMYSVNLGDELAFGNIDFKIQVDHTQPENPLSPCISPTQLCTNEAFDFGNQDKKDSKNSDGSDNDETASESELEGLKVPVTILSTKAEEKPGENHRHLKLKEVLSDDDTSDGLNEELPDLVTSEELDVQKEIFAKPFPSKAKESKTKCEPDSLLFAATQPFLGNQNKTRCSESEEENENNSDDESLLSPTQPFFKSNQNVKTAKETLFVKPVSPAKKIPKSLLNTSSDSIDPNAFTQPCLALDDFEDDTDFDCETQPNISISAETQLMFPKLDKRNSRLSLRSKPSSNFCDKIDYAAGPSNQDDIFTAETQPMFSNNTDMEKTEKKQTSDISLAETQPSFVCDLDSCSKNKNEDFLNAETQPMFNGDIVSVSENRRKEFQNAETQAMVSNDDWNAKVRKEKSKRESFLLAETQPMFAGKTMNTADDSDSSVTDDELMFAETQPNFQKKNNSKSLTVSSSNSKPSGTLLVFEESFVGNTSKTSDILCMDSQPNSKVQSPDTLNDSSTQKLSLDRSSVDETPPHITDSSKKNHNILNITEVAERLSYSVDAENEQDTIKASEITPNVSRFMKKSQSGSLSSTLKNSEDSREMVATLTPKDSSELKDSASSLTQRNSDNFQSDHNLDVDINPSENITSTSTSSNTKKRFSRIFMASDTDESSADDVAASGSKLKKPDFDREAIKKITETNSVSLKDHSETRVANNIDEILVNNKFETRNDRNKIGIHRLSKKMNLNTPKPTARNSQVDSVLQPTEMKTASISKPNDEVMGFDESSTSESEIRAERKASIKDVKSSSKPGLKKKEDSKKNSEIAEPVGKAETKETTTSVKKSRKLAKTKEINNSKEKLENPSEKHSTDKSNSKTGSKRKNAVKPTVESTNSLTTDTRTSLRVRRLPAKLRASFEMDSSSDSNQSTSRRGSRSPSSRNNIVQPKSSESPDLNSKSTIKNTVDTESGTDVQFSEDDEMFSKASRKEMKLSVNPRKSSRTKSDSKRDGSTVQDENIESTLKSETEIKIRFTEIENTKPKRGVKTKVTVKSDNLPEIKSYDKCEPKNDTSKSSEVDQHVLQIDVCKSAQQSTGHRNSKSCPKAKDKAKIDNPFKQIENDQTEQEADENIMNVRSKSTIIIRNDDQETELPSEPSTSKSQDTTKRNSQASTSSDLAEKVNGKPERNARKLKDDSAITPQKTLHMDDKKLEVRAGSSRLPRPKKGAPILEGKVMELLSDDFELSKRSIESPKKRGRPKKCDDTEQEGTLSKTKASIESDKTSDIALESARRPGRSKKEDNLSKPDPVEKDVQSTKSKRVGRKQTTDKLYVGLSVDEPSLEVTNESTTEINSEELLTIKRRGRSKNDVTIISGKTESSDITARPVSKPPPTKPSSSKKSVRKRKTESEASIPDSTEISELPQRRNDATASPVSKPSPFKSSTSSKKSAEKRKTESEASVPSSEEISEMPQRRNKQSKISSAATELKQTEIASKGNDSTAVVTEKTPRRGRAQKKNELTVLSTSSVDDVFTVPNVPTGKRQSPTESCNTPVKRGRKSRRDSESSLESNETGSTSDASSSGKRMRLKKPSVMFTGLSDPDAEKVITNLGGQIVSEVSSCSHLVTDKFRRTVKFLCCVGKGLPIVGLSWIKECKKKQAFIDEEKFILKDKDAEKTHSFQLSKTLTEAATSPLFKGWSLHVTSSVIPSPEQMREIIECAGGKFLPKCPARFSERTVVVSHENDKKTSARLAKMGFPTVTNEFVLTGLVRHKIDFKEFSL